MTPELLDTIHDNLHAITNNAHMLENLSSVLYQSGNQYLADKLSEIAVSLHHSSKELNSVTGQVVSAFVLGPQEQMHANILSMLEAVKDL